MLTFDTPHPIRATVDVAGALLIVRAVDGGETSVDVRPHNPRRSADVELADRTTVDLVGGRLVVRSSRTTRSRVRTLFRGGERVDLDVSLPVGSTLDVRGWADVRTAGPLDDVDIDTAMGDVNLDWARRVRVKTSMGEISVGSTTGTAELWTSAGSVQVGRAGADLTARTSAGDVRVETGEGELRLVTSAGDVRVERAASTVAAKTSAGDIRLRCVGQGSVTAETSYGQIEIGVPAGSAAWLDVEARHGAVRSELEQTEGPAEGDRTVDIRATAGYGDIVLRRVAAVSDEGPRDAP